MPACNLTIEQSCFLLEREGWGKAGFCLCHKDSALEKVKYWVCVNLSLPGIREKPHNGIAGLSPTFRSIIFMTLAWDQYASWIMFYLFRPYTDSSFSSPLPLLALNFLIWLFSDSSGVFLPSVWMKFELWCQRTHIAELPHCLNKKYGLFGLS